MKKVSQICVVVAVIGIAISLLVLICTELFNIDIFMTEKYILGALGVTMICVFVMLCTAAKGIFFDN